MLEILIKNPALARAFKEKAGFLKIAQNSPKKSAYLESDMVESLGKPQKNVQKELKLSFYVATPTS